MQRFANLTFVSSSDLDKPVVERELVGDATEQGNFKCCETLVVTNDRRSTLTVGTCFPGIMTRMKKKSKRDTIKEKFTGE